jgi:DNA-binding transcriptional ArsR family regulator
MGKAGRQPNKSRVNAARAGTARAAAARGDTPTPGVRWAAPAAERTASGARWTFLTNHSHVLILLSQDPTLVLREVAVRVGITERAVQRIIADLEQAGFLDREKLGRRNRYRIRSNQALRHPIESHHTVGELIALVSSR